VRRREREVYEALVRTFDAFTPFRPVEQQNADLPLCRHESHRRRDYVAADGVIRCGVCHPDPRSGNARVTGSPR
jgi:hypothetical protein